jgi:demethylmenaquinone methyltransferase/2-methoxy-6-polyprenyl-1,4-benzoquinol methylase
MKSNSPIMNSLLLFTLISPHIKDIYNFTRVLRSKEDSRDFYDSISSWYDMLAYSSEKKFVNECLEELTIDKGIEVLEIGFGTGHGIEKITRKVGKKGKVSGIDISTKMKDLTEKILREQGLMDQVDLVVGDAASLPFPDNEFDKVFLSFTLELFDTPEIPKVLGEIKRVLKSEGEVGIVGLSNSKRNIMDRLYEKVHLLIPKYLDCRPIPISSLVKDAGFIIKKKRTGSMWGLTVDTVIADLPDL